MSLKIRLSRGGAKKRPFYRIVVADARMPRDGRFVEKIGTFDPVKAKDDATRLVLDVEKAKAWLANGDFEQPDPPAVDRLGEIAVPAVLMIGDQDHPPLIECDEMIVAGIPGCRKIEVPGGDHLLPLRVPALVADAITELAG